MQGDKGEFLRRPGDDFFGQTREVDADHRGDELVLGEDIAAGGSVDRVLDRVVEAQIGGHGLRVQAQRGAGQGPGSSRWRRRHVRRSRRICRHRAAAARRGPADGGPGARAGRAGGGCGRASVLHGERRPGR